MSKAALDARYSGRLAAFGDPVLDAMAAAVKEPKARAAKQPEPAKCPSCTRTRILYRKYYASLCAECHMEISELARRPRW